MDLQSQDGLHKELRRILSSGQGPAQICDELITQVVDSVRNSESEPDAIGYLLIRFDGRQAFAFGHTVECAIANAKSADPGFEMGSHWYSYAVPHAVCYCVFAHVSRESTVN